jgi:hypothetical protein
MARRPKIIIDFDAVKRLAAVMATDEEIASYFGCSVDTLTRRGEEYRQAKEAGRQAGALNLRRYQIEAAKAKNPTMLIWLGKQYLGQKDKTEVEHSGAIARPLQGLTAEELREALRLAKENGQE